MGKRADDIMNRKGFGRKNILDKDVPFREQLPLALRNKVSNRSSKAKQKVCMSEMMEVIACMAKYEQNQTMCSKEITAFEKCYSDALAKKADVSSSEASKLGSRAKLTAVELNSYMKNFAQSTRDGQQLRNSTFKDHWKYK